MEAEGELEGTTPLTVTIIPQALRIAAPALAPALLLRPWSAGSLFQQLFSLIARNYADNHQTETTFNLPIGTKTLNFARVSDTAMKTIVRHECTLSAVLRKRCG